MKSSFTYEGLSKLKGKDVRSADGEKIGTVKEIFYDPDTRTPEWIGLGTGLLGLKERVVPLEGARVEGDTIRVIYDKDIVADEPDFDDDEGVLSPDSERQLCEYFGVMTPSKGTHRLNRYEFPGS